MQTANSSVEKGGVFQHESSALRLAHWLPQVYSSIECLQSQRELHRVTFRTNSGILTSVCFCYCCFLNLLVGVQFHWIFFFFSIVFVPMIENSSWSLTFEEVSWSSSICVCLYSCLSLKKCGIILLIVTRLPQLCKSCAGREGEAEESCVFLFKWYQL